MNDFLKYMSNDEILCEFEQASVELRGSGARGRSRLADVKQELLKRMGVEEYDN